MIISVRLCSEIDVVLSRLKN
jgi:hypothetical protein